MFYITHMTFSFFISLLLYTWIPGIADIIPPAEWYAIALISSALPDVGHLLDKLELGTRTNRLMTHCLIGFGMFAAGFGFLSWYINAGYVYAVPFVFGYLSHLMTDSMKPAGINWLWPIDAKRYSIGNIRTGSKEEVVFEATLTVGILSVFLL